MKTNIINNEVINAIREQINSVSIPGCNDATWDTLQAISDNVSELSEADTSNNRNGYPRCIQRVLVVNSDFSALTPDDIDTLVDAFNLRKVLLSRRDGQQFWYIEDSNYLDNSIDRTISDGERVDTETFTKEENQKYLDNWQDEYDGLKAEYGDATEDEDGFPTPVGIHKNNRDKVLQEFAKMQDDDLLVCSTDTNEYIKTISRYAIRYHDDDVTIWSIGLVEK